MKKICFLVGNINLSGGTERVTSLVVNELINHQYDISVLSLADGCEPFFELNSQVNKYSLYSGKVSFKKNFIGVLWKIRQFVKKHQIDTLIVVDSMSCLFTIPALYGINLNHICWEHFNFRNNNGVKLRSIARKWAAKYCDYIITLTERDKRLWEKGLQKIRAEIVPIGNPTSYQNITHTPNLNFKVVLAVGRLTHVKGFDILIEAWSQICRKNTDWVLRIVGSGEDEKKLKQQAKNLNIQDSVDFIPRTKDIDYYYKTSSFYCLSSRFEGLPMVLIEAQAFGLPLISFDCDTGPSDIIVNNINGYLIKNGDITELAISLNNACKISDKKYMSMVLASKINTNKLSIDNIIVKWKDIL